MGPLTKLVGGSIGLVAEYNAHRKASRSPSPKQDAIEEQSGNHSDQSTDHDEENWELDEVQHYAHSDDAALTGEEGVPTEQVLTAFFEKYPGPPPYTEISNQHLPAPIILPQRRPQTHARGFIRAYAPALHDRSISQEMWMDFLTGFHKAIKMSPAFHVANISVGVGALALDAISGPSLTGHAIAMAIHISVEASRRAYTHYNTNKYLDRMNEQIFRPRGLYALIMTYKLNSTSADEVIDMNTAFTQAVGARIDPNHRSKLHMSAGKTTSERHIPAAAPLIFPALDQLPASEKASLKKKNNTAFLSDYFDRRARARFTAEHPESKLNVLPDAEFASRYSDPNHAANNSGVMGLVSGGTIPDRRTRRQGRRDRWAANATDGDQVGNGKPVPQRQGPMGMLKKTMKENVLYLVVVDLPSEEEMREVNAALDG